MWGCLGLWARGEEVEGKFRWKKKRGREKMLSSGAERMQEVGKPGGWLRRSKCLRIIKRGQEDISGGKGINPFLFCLTEAKASGSAVQNEEQPLP